MVSGMLGSQSVYFRALFNIFWMKFRDFMGKVPIAGIYFREWPKNSPGKLAVSETPYSRVPNCRGPIKEGGGWKIWEKFAKVVTLK